MSEEKRIAIHGLGYVGLTAAVHWAKAGWQVLGFDPDVSTVNRLNAGTPRAGEFLSYLDADVKALVDAGLLKATTDYARTLDYKVHSIAVPTEKDGTPYDEIVFELLEKLFSQLASGAMILVESTLAPGTIDRVLEHYYESVGLFSDSGLNLAVCPRRDWFASQTSHLGAMKRIVGGVTPACTARAIELLHEISPDIEPTTYRTAELTKALENALLHTAVMLPTELAMNMRDRDIAEATRLASTHPRLMRLFLGAGAGGRCIPLGPQYLNEYRGRHDLLTQSLKIDRHIRMEVARAVSQRGCKTALVLGLAYRPDFKDMGNSPGLAVARYLSRDFGISTTVHDPMWPGIELQNITGFRAADAELDIEAAHMAFYDAVVLVTPHSLYVQWPGTYLDPLKKLKFVLDAQGTWASQQNQFLEREIEYKQLGMSGWLR